MQRAFESLADFVLVFGLLERGIEKDADENGGAQADDCADLGFADWREASFIFCDEIVPSVVTWRPLSGESAMAPAPKCAATKTTSKAKMKTKSTAARFDETEPAATNSKAKSKAGAASGAPTNPKLERGQLKEPARRRRYQGQVNTSPRPVWLFRAATLRRASAKVPFEYSAERAARHLQAARSFRSRSVRFGRNASTTGMGVCWLRTSATRTLY